MATTATAVGALPEQELSPRQNAPSSMEQAIQSLGSMNNTLGTLDLRADPDAQATVTDFLDFTEYLPADMARSLTLIGKLDQTYINSSTKVHNLTKIWGQLPSMLPHERPAPIQLRADISQSLNQALSSRIYSHAEAVRMAENATRHYNRAKIILSKLQTMLENYPTAEEQKSPVVATKTPAGRGTKITLRVNDGRKVRGRPVPRITVPGEVLPPLDFDYDAYSTSESSSEEDDDDEEEDESPTGSTPAPPQVRIKVSKTPKASRPPKGPKTSQTSVPPPAIPKPGQPIPSRVELKPPPENAVVGSDDAPWLQLTPYELARLRKRMKKNAQWSPSDTMIARELKALGRGTEAYRKAKQEAEEEGKPFEPIIPALVADSSGVEHPPLGALSLDAALAAEDKSTNNRGLKLNEAKKLKKENLARLAAEEAEESARKMRETVNALFPTALDKPPGEPSPSGSRSVAGKSSKSRKRKRDSAPEGDGEAEKPAETVETRLQQKRTKTETPVPLPQQNTSNVSSTQNESQIPAPQNNHGQSTTPIPPPVPGQEQQQQQQQQQAPVVPAVSGVGSAKGSAANSPPATGAVTVTTMVPVKPPASELPLPPHSPKKSTTPILPPVRETRKSSQATMKKEPQPMEIPTATPAAAAVSAAKSASRPGSPGLNSLASPGAETANLETASGAAAGTVTATGRRPASRSGKAASQEPLPTLASDRTRRASTARNTPAPPDHQHQQNQQNQQQQQQQHGLAPRQERKRGRKPAPGVISRTNSGGSSAVGKRKAAPRKKARTSSSVKKERGANSNSNMGGGGNQRASVEAVEVEVEVDDEGEPIDPDEPRYCLCNNVSYGMMIQCDNLEDCQYEWFHLGCVKMNDIPARTTKWYCPSCRVRLNIGEKGEVSARGAKS